MNDNAQVSLNLSSKVPMGHTFRTLTRYALRGCLVPHTRIFAAIMIVSALLLSGVASAQTCWVFDEFLQSCEVMLAYEQEDVPCEDCHPTTHECQEWLFTDVNESITNWSTEHDTSASLYYEGWTDKGTYQEFCGTFGLCESDCTRITTGPTAYYTCVVAQTTTVNIDAVFLWGETCWDEEE